MVYFFFCALLCNGKHELVVSYLDATEDAVLREMLLQGIHIAVVANYELVEERLIVGKGEMPRGDELVAQIVGTCV